MADQGITINASEGALRRALNEAYSRGMSLSEFTEEAWLTLVGQKQPQTPEEEGLPDDYGMMPGVSHLDQHDGPIESSLLGGEPRHITPDVLWGQFKIFPMKYTLRVLSRLMAEQGAITMVQWQDEVRTHSLDARETLRTKDTRYQLPRGEQLATSFPRRDAKSMEKSVQRFVNHYCGIIQGGGRGDVVGMPAEIGFIEVEKGKKEVRLTEQGASFVSLPNPQMEGDEVETKVLWPEERLFLIKHLAENLPLDWEFCTLVLRAISEGSDKSDELEEAVMALLGEDDKWEKVKQSGFSTYVRGALGRCGELGLVERTWDKRKVTYHLSDEAVEVCLI